MAGVQNDAVRFAHRILRVAAIDLSIFQLLRNISYSKEFLTVRSFFCRLNDLFPTSNQKYGLFLVWIP
ncbi:MAG: hypothetical protein WCK89_21100, partial [bacterium]